MATEQTPDKQSRTESQPRSVAEFARSRGVTTQAVYKRLAKLGIDPNSLRSTRNGNKAGSSLSEEGLAILAKAMDGGLESSTVNQKPSTVNHQPSTDEGDGEAEALRNRIASLQHDLIEARHKTEMAEIRATAAEDERDYLRSQLDNAIKASALASMKRIAAASTEEDEQSQRGSVVIGREDPATDGPVRRSDQEQPRSLRQRWRDAVMAWKGKS